LHQVYQTLKQNLILPLKSLLVLDQKVHPKPNLYNQDSFIIILQSLKKNPSLDLALLNLLLTKLFQINQINCNITYLTIS
jgi:hypothetical protein